jgi:hypothetical protein
MIALLMASTAALADEVPRVQGAMTVGGVVHPVEIHVDMASLPPVAEWQPGDPLPVAMPRSQEGSGQIPPVPAGRGFDDDPLLARQLAAGPLPGGGIETQLLNQDGFVNTGSPSDIISDVGRQYFIQVVNATPVRIFDKFTGAVDQTFELSNLAAGTGTGCGAGIGDPVINFDQLADRWLISEFTGDSICVYVSQTSDPTTGDWFLYEFQSATNTLPDYFKIGVWPDAYYVGANDVIAAPGGGNGRTNYAFDRVNMLAGAPARPAQVFVSGPELLGYAFQLLQPADLDGDALPPAGAPGILLRHRDDEVHNNPPDVDPAADFIDVFEIAVDFDTPANSSITGPLPVAVAEFDSDLCGTFNFNCVEQAGSGVILDSVAEPIMWRVQHRIVDGQQLMVGSFTVDVDGNDLHGVRWFILARPDGVASGGWTLQQEGTYALGDSTQRWLPSIAMDRRGNVVVGISVTDPDTGVFPGARYSGRLVSDPPGTLPRGEFSLVEGLQPNSSTSRWGDYASVNVDPDDDCTFYFSTQWNESTVASTRLGAFRFDSCLSLPEVFFVDGFEDLPTP